LIDDAHIRRLDLTVLIVFERLLVRRNMSAVAVEMGLTQSAISHATARLRAVFDDPLFVRNGLGVAPTARALRLAVPLAEALAAVRDAMQVGRKFDPATTARDFVLAAPDTIVGALAPAILSAFARTAPRCQIMFRSLGHIRSAEAVVSEEVDLAVGVFIEPPAATIATWLRRETFLVASRQDHPLLTAGLDLDTYCALDHMLVSHDRSPRGIVDTVLEGLGRQRRIAAVMPQLMIAFAAACRSEAIITAPVDACRYAASLLPIALHEPPIDIPGLDLTLLRHRDSLADPAVSWLATLTTHFFCRSAELESDDRRTVR
jgi:DNA-binding transcriptional LysR family regulator